MLAPATAQEILDQVFGATDFTPKANLYLALFLANPGNDGPGVEVSGGAYARLALANNMTTWAGATLTSPSAKANAIDFTFATPTADWGAVSYVAFFDAASGGNKVWSSKLATQVTVLDGVPFVISAGNFIISLGASLNYQSGC